MKVELFKPKHRSPATGQLVEYRKWYLRFQDHLGIDHRWPALADERASRTWADRIGDLVDCRQCGDYPGERLMRWVETAPEDLRQRLVAADLLDPSHSAKGELLVVHLEGKRDAAGEIVMPGYRQHLMRGRKDRAAEADTMIGRIRRVLDGCGFVEWRDLCRPGAVTAVETFLGQLRDRGYVRATSQPGRARRRKINGRTLAYYVRELKGFCRWMVEVEGRAATDPMVSLRGPTDAETDARERRELPAEEVRWLLQTTAARQQVRYELAADERVLLYRFAFETGIRPGQLRKLTAASFELDATPPTVTSGAATVKR
jgi:hypothetical protein